MQIKTILNRVQKFTSFVYGAVSWVDGALVPTLEVKDPRPREQPAAVWRLRAPEARYDTLPERRFEFIPLWGHKVFFVYAPRRVSCRCCGIRVERMPWVAGKHRLTDTYAWFLAGWAKRLSWQDVAEAFRTTWDHVFSSVERAVAWGRAHQDLSGVTAIGVDEIAWQRGHRYLTLVYQIDADCKRLLWIGEKRTVKTLLRFFRWFGQARNQALQFVCSDMWKPYLKVIAKKAGTAVHILDRYHIMTHLSKAIDEVRAQEARALKENGYEAVLTKTRWLLLKRPEHLTATQGTRLADLLRNNLRSIRSYLLKEEFQLFWLYTSPYWAGRFLDKWCTKTMRSKIRPMKKVAKMLRRHRPLLLNWFRFRTYHAVEVALYHALGALPMPKTAHEFFLTRLVFQREHMRDRQTHRRVMRPRDVPIA